jgi:lysozyme family protein
MKWIRNIFAKKRNRRIFAVLLISLCAFLVWFFYPTRFDRAVSFTLKWEGEFSDMEHDRGGKTKYGITAPFLEDYKGAITLGGTPDCVQDINRWQAVQMYHALWNKEQLDGIRNESIARALFDYTVHSSARKVIGRMQHLLNTQFGAHLPEDGKMGVQTISVINRQNARTLFDSLQAERRRYLRTFISENPDQKAFENGWMRRINDIRFEP